MDKLKFYRWSFAKKCIAFLCIQVYQFQEQKLEQGKYDEYGLWMIFCTGLCIYLSHHYLHENGWQWMLKIIGAIFVTGFSIAYIGKQFFMIFSIKSFHFKENDFPDLLVINFGQVQF
ncbi:hypothetical protein ACQVTS_30770 [Bacillus mycoides]|uniref:hypothetical protein n=1 Tax=Bacillus mycoides TaxID=1405 RepID=UPI003D64C7E3